MGGKPKKETLKEKDTCRNRYTRQGTEYCWLTSTTCQSTKNRGMCKKK